MRAVEKKKVERRGRGIYKNIVCRIDKRGGRSYSGRVCVKMRGVVDKEKEEEGGGERRCGT